MSFKNPAKGNRSHLYEGKELGQTTKSILVNSKKPGILDELNATKKARNAENIEEQYIKGLQDEVKLLEYEMKLLKDKESDEVQNFSHFFKFFNDGVPINENIIAMKNLYQATEKTLNDTIKQLRQQNAEGQKEIAYLKKDIEQIKARLDENREIMKEKETDNTEKQLRFNTQYYDEIHTIEELEPKQKILVEEIRAKNNDINIMKRDEEKENLYAEQKQKQKDDKLKNLKKKVFEIEQLILEKRKLKENEEDGAKFEQEKNLIDQENEQLKKKILNTKNEASQAQVKKAELEFLLESQAGDRELEQRNRRILVQQIEDVKTQIENENKMSETVLAERVKEKEKDDIRKIELQIDNINKKEIQVYQDRVQYCTQEIESMVFAKVDLQQKITDAEDQKESLEKGLEEAKQNLHDLKRENNLSLDKEQELQKKLQPLEQEVRKVKERFPKITKEIEYYQQQIDGYKKQVNSSINQLIKKWENIEMQSRN
ncbi:hypothetical protein PPERSA_07672 [Pseudocohnilembus persalinus]|uniref:Uncharacterized protein n=1 Tax=Pseudocohnilembus persalinus TaxID=266149 RepID=A0A0V0QIN1_PSEPJ|nr:hypothetical protein PPERSA_07672 [Pseudocohnilembus persalinus]|eukprot:KRX02027.1 hypothetical protein PPERSA_07672 [Pseudocohnilembus persalinus]